MLGPPRLVRKIWLQMHLRLGHDVAVQVEQQGAHALGAVVDGEDGLGGHGGRL